MTVWRVLINPKLWDVEAFRASGSTCIAQAKGKCKMKRVPQKGDTVKFVVKGSVIMIGTVSVNGFRHGEEVILDECNLGVAPHRSVDEYTWVNDVTFCPPTPIKWRGQRTWSVLPKRLVRAPVCEDPIA